MQVPNPIYDRYGLCTPKEYQELITYLETHVVSQLCWESSMNYFDVYVSHFFASGRNIKSYKYVISSSVQLSDDFCNTNFDIIQVAVHYNSGESVPVALIPSACAHALRIAADYEEPAYLELGAERYMAALISGMRVDK